MSSPKQNLELSIVNLRSVVDQHINSLRQPLVEKQAELRSLPRGTKQLEIDRLLKLVPTSDKPQNVLFQVVRLSEVNDQELLMARLGDEAAETLTPTINAIGADHYETLSSIDYVMASLIELARKALLLRAQGQLRETGVGGNIHNSIEAHAASMLKHLGKLKAIASAEVGQTSDDLYAFVSNVTSSAELI